MKCNLNKAERQRSPAPSGEELLAYVDEELSKDEHKRIEAHLEGCPECQQELKALSQTQTTWQRFLETRALSPNFLARVKDRIPKETPALRRRAGWVTVATSTILLIFLGTNRPRRWYMKRSLRFGFGFAFCLALVALFIIGVGEKPVMAYSSVTSGALRIIDKEGNLAGTCPLKHTEVATEISGYVARVKVTQEFINPYEEKIEAIYIFPLSQNGAVDDMVMKVGDRTIKGEIKRREEARQIYEAAKAAGQVASLLDQERPNIFTQSVANIMPGESVTITISYVELLKYEDGEYSFVFPMVVGPRYIPGSPIGKKGTGWSPDTYQVPDASRITPPVTPPETRAGHDISVSVTLNAGLPIKAISSKLHEINTHTVNDTTVQIALKTRKTIPNKDFILTWQVAGDKIEDAILTHGKDGKGFFTLILQPPKRPTQSQIIPKEMIFVIDNSGSMRGYPIDTAKQTMKLCIEMMNPNDSFNITAFANSQLKLFEKPQPNTKANREKGLNFLAQCMGSGGTQMLPAIEAALTPPENPEHLRIVCFMTDGYVGNDMEILGTIKKNLGNARIFAFGIGNSVNRFLLDKMAEMGKGEVDYVTLGEPAHPVAERFHERIACPLLTDISVDWGSLVVEDIYPKAIPDLFSSKPVILRGRYTKSAKSEITLKGKVGGKDFSRKIEVNFPAEESANSSLASLWARARIDDLMAQDWQGIQSGRPKADIKEQITHLGLEFHLMTQYTSFVAVEEMIITEGGKPRTIAVPVEMPEGVSYEGVFGKRSLIGDRLRRKNAGRQAYFLKSRDLVLRGSTEVNARLSTAPATKPYQLDALISGDDASYYGIDEYAPKTREEKIKAKLDKALQGLAEKVAKEGKDGNLTLKDFEVKDGKVEIKVYLNDTSKEKIEQLKKLGLKILAEPRAIKMVIGRLEVGKLEALAQLEFVVLVMPLGK